jgi:diadenosine tetraphosphate (Ap4A) HIT family hydrolase
MPKCPFCSRPGDISRNTFYERDGWFAFLDGNPITRGHTILAKRQLRAGRCPVDITRHLKGHDHALVAVVDIINAHYRPKSVLFASLRSSTKHMHTHVYPFWAKPESRWRKTSNLMVTEYFTQTNQVNCQWSDIPTSFDVDDLTRLRVK